jgi:hypothetical protein
MISMDEEGAIKKVISDINENAPGAEIILVDSSIDLTPDIAVFASKSALSIASLKRYTSFDC